jgi:mannose-6-phosphate isomerase-like protein (cupin superfamily)
MTRLEAYAADDRWIGEVSSDPGVASGWHHHGAHETYFYVVAGATLIELGGGRSFEVHAGEFAHIPAGTVHRESTLGAARLTAIVIRMGTGPQVFDADEPNAPSATT